MPLNLISNFAANVAQRNLASADALATTSLSRLSAGSRVIGAKDDAASLAVGSRLSAEVSALKQVAINAGQAISMLQVADGAMAKVNEVLVRMKSLSVQAGSSTLTATGRNMINTEYAALLLEVERIADDTDFAGTRLVRGTIDVQTYAAPNFGQDDGILGINLESDFDPWTNGTIGYDSANGAFSVTVGSDLFSGAMDPNSHDGTWMNSSTLVNLTSTSSTNKMDILVGVTFWMGFAHASGVLNFTSTNSADFTFKVGTGGADPSANDVTVTINSLVPTVLGVDSTDVTTKANADTASTAVSSALDLLQTSRSTIGADLNRLEFAAANIASATENTEAARSRLLDLDIALEMSSFLSRQILAQTGVSMLAQANNMPSNLLRLFR